MTTALIINLALTIPVFAAIIGLVLWSIRSQSGDRAHVLVRTRRPARATAPRPAAQRPRFDSSRRAWPAR
jgi:hypothetical protein